jgi:hypothetical protein
MESSFSLIIARDEPASDTVYQPNSITSQRDKNYGMTNYAGLWTILRLQSGIDGMGTDF